MRLAGQMRGGFFPAAEQSVALAATFLRPPPKEPFALLDPCAGEGAAIGQLGGLLGCPQAITYAIELDESRAAKLHAAMPKANVLAPASFFGCHASLNSFSLIWLNPPFDDGYGGQRMELGFLLTATQWLMPGGVMALVCPDSVAGEYTDVRGHFTCYFENCSIVLFPRNHRPFSEVIVFGHKRAKPQAERNALAWEKVQAPRGFVYQIPPSKGPKAFLKAEPTESELTSMLEASPLRLRLKTLPEIPLPSPPLALGIGHVALLLASGNLDGVVAPPGEAPHVVRGTSRKREFVSSVTETDNADGSVTTKTTLSEKIELVVRTVDQTGEIRTFLDGDGAAEA